MTIVKMMSTIKRVPQRTCVACRQVKDKWQLVRLVRLADGGIEVDSDNGKAGRGAYICLLPRCWQSGIEAGRLEHALRTSLTRENRERLILFGKKLDGELVSG